MIDKIKEALKEVTICEWFANQDDGWPVGYVPRKVFNTGNSNIDDKDWTVWTEPMPGSELSSDAKTDAEYIALVNPQNIKELIERLENAEALLDQSLAANDSLVDHMAVLEHNKKYNRQIQMEMRA